MAGHGATSAATHARVMQDPAAAGKLTCTALESYFSSQHPYAGLSICLDSEISKTCDNSGCTASRFCIRPLQTCPRRQLPATLFTGLNDCIGLHLCLLEGACNASKRSAETLKSLEVTESPLHTLRNFGRHAKSVSIMLVPSPCSGERY